MKKIVPQTKDITSENIHQIAKLFPQVITEKEDENGNTIKGIDFESLKQHLSKDLVENSDERYRLDWPGKRASILKANTPITSTLKPDRESSVNFDTTENIYIEGDNFEVLKILQESYLGKVKMIYIDPPYNTGKDFVYKDNFKVSKEDYETELGTEDEEGGKLFKNTDTNGRFHSDWLSMMYERLLVARDLLTEDGVIFMSIDENEIHNLRKISDEIFGEENFIADLIWQNKKGGGNDSKHIAIEHEYILSFSKNKNLLHNFYESYSEEYAKRYREEDEKGLFYWDTFKRKSGKQYYAIECPDGSILDKDENGSPISWLRSESRFIADKKSNEIRFVDIKGRYSVQFKQRMPEGKKPRSIFKTNNLLDNRGTTSSGSNDIFSYFNKDVFSNPKPIDLISFLLGFSSNSNDIILDFFSGSGTLAEAVMKLNANENGMRKFILVQLCEDLSSTLANSSSNAKRITENAIEFLNSINKPLNIPELALERIRRAGKKILEENVDKLKERETPLDVGFRVYKTAETILKDVAKHPDELTQTEMFASEDNIKEDATSEDILTAVLLDFGEKLDNTIETKIIAGSEIFIVDENALVACFSKNIDMQVVDVIAKMQPIRAVFRDACFKDDKDLINTVESRFKQVAPNTKVHVI